MNRNCRNTYTYIILAGMICAQCIAPIHCVGRFTDRFTSNDNSFEQEITIDNYEAEISPAQDDYARICDEVPTQPLPRWRVMLNRFGSALVVRFAALRNFFSTRYERFKTWLRVHAWQRIRRERTAQQA